MYVDYKKDVFILTCAFQENHLLDGLDKRWSKAKRHWRVYDARLNRINLRAICRNLPEGCISPEASQHLQDTALTSTKDIKLDIKLDSRLLPYQATAVRTMLTLKYGYINAPLGSGKTFIAISLCRALYEAGEIDKILIIGLVSLKLNWEAEFYKWWPDCDAALLITGVESYSQGKLYDKVKGYVDNTTCIILDECVSIKTPTATRSKRVIKLSKRAARRYAMSGLPITQGIHDLFNQYAFLHPDIIGIKTFVGFRNRYCVLGGYEGRKIIGYRHKEELMACIRPYTFKISQKDCMPYLPDKTFIDVKIQLSPAQTKEIKRLKTELTLNGDAIENVLTLLLRIAQEAGKPEGAKMKALLSVVENVDKAVIFAQFTDEIRGIAAALNCPAIYGEISVEERHRLVTEFQEGKHRFIVLQYAAGSHGLNLDAACHTVFYSHTFNFAQRKQAEGRIARLTQKRKMFYHSLVARGCTDALVMRAIEAKQDVSEYVQEQLSRGELKL